MVITTDHADNNLAAEFSATQDADGNNILVYSGAWPTEYEGTLTLVMSNAAGQSSTYVYTLKLLVPAAPTFATDPAAFNVFVGYDYTYTFPVITDGTETPSVFTVSVDTISASEYTFDEAAGTIQIHGSDNSVFDSLAGTTLTLTSTLSHASASRTYTQTVSIQTYQPPVLSAPIASSVPLYPFVPMEFSFPEVTHHGNDFIATLDLDLYAYQDSHLAIVQ